MKTESQTNSDATKITFITNIPAPYKTPRLNALAERDDVELQVYYANAETGRHNYEHLPQRRFDWDVFKTKRLSMRGSEVMVNLNSAPKLMLTSADALVVAGWNYTAAWEALAASKVRNIPVALLSENLEQKTRSSDVVMSKLVPHFDAYFAASSKAKSNLVRLGAAENQVVVLPYCIDVDAFQSGIDDAVQKQIRDNHDISAPHIVLYVGLLEDRKNVDDLISAMDGLGRESTHLLVVGDGPKRAKLEKQASNIDVPTTFTGNVPNQELANYYALASVFVLPSRKEPWGLVQNEALACGTPVVSTTESGAVGDLVVDGENGLVVEPGSPSQLRDAILELLNNQDKRERMAQAGLERSQDFTPRTYAETIKSAADNMLARNN